MNSERTLFVSIGARIGVLPDTALPLVPRLTFPDLRRFNEDPDVRAIRLSEQGRRGKDRVGHYTQVLK
jgi:hypothetical protein